MAYRSSNPVFTNRTYAPSPDALSEMYAQPARVTLDDVVLHTAGLLALVTLTRTEVNGVPLPRGSGPRVATLVAVLLADLLDRD